MHTLLLSLVAAAGLAPGTAVPDVSAPNQDGKVIKLSDYRGKPVLLYFYPKDDTPGCTKEACSLRDDYAKFQAAGVVILGVSRQDAESHKAFRAKYHLPFDLLVDADGKFAEALRVETMPVVGFHKRQSLLIDPEGKIAKFFPDVDPTTHSAEVLQLLAKMKK
jgi:peroxiredoxin Q/BCP